MPRLVRKVLLSDHKLSLEIACRTIIASLKKDSVLRQTNTRELSQYVVFVDSVDAIEVLKGSDQLKKFYWRDRDAELEWAGVGAAAEFCESKNYDVQERVTEFLHSSEASVQLFGAKNFDDSHSSTDESFLCFPKTYFALPILQISTTYEGTSIAINVEIGDAEKVEEAIKLLRQISIDRPKDEKISAGHLISHAFVTGFEKWKEQVQTVLRLLDNGQAEKVVLANARDFFFDQPNPPLAVFEELCRRTSSTYRYFLQLEENRAFLGASPEQLYSRNGLRIESEAQAGTRKRGKDEAEDAAFSNDLLNSVKDYSEHDVVLKDVESHLSKLCRDCGWIDKRQIVKLKHVQHLRSRFGGILNDRVTDFEIMNALHPTSAVCGMPKETARDVIGAIESFNRGYYSGPIGIIGSVKTQFAVALRSAVISGNRIRAFAGAGLVQGSNPEDEWNEIESKMRPFYEMFVGEI